MAQAISNSRDELAKALDSHNPNWAVKYADQRDLIDFITESKHGSDRAMAMLRNRVSASLFEVVRAAVHAGLVTSKEGF